MAKISIDIEIEHYIALKKRAKEEYISVSGYLRRMIKIEVESFEENKGEISEKNSPKKIANWMQKKID